MSNDNRNQAGDRWAPLVSIIALLTIALLLLPPLPPWSREAAIVVVALAAVACLAFLPPTQPMWQRWLSDLPSDDQRAARRKRALDAIGVLVVGMTLLPRLRIAAVALAVFALLRGPGDPFKYTRGMVAYARSLAERRPTGRKMETSAWLDRRTCPYATSATTVAAAVQACRCHARAICRSSRSRRLPGAAGHLAAPA